jgi:hypothetical protein
VYQLYVKVDDKGNIVDSIGGENLIVINYVYDYFFEVDEETLKNISNFKVENGQLVLK